MLGPLLPIAHERVTILTKWESMGKADGMEALGTSAVSMGLFVLW